MRCTVGLLTKEGPLLQLPKGVLALKNWAWWVFFREKVGLVNMIGPYRKNVAYKGIFWILMVHKTGHPSKKRARMA